MEAFKSNAKSKHGVCLLFDLTEKSWKYANCVQKAPYDLRVKPYSTGWRGASYL